MWCVFKQQAKKPRGIHPIQKRWHVGHRVSTNLLDMTHSFHFFFGYIALLSLSFFFPFVVCCFLLLCVSLLLLLLSFFSTWARSLGKGNQGATKAAVGRGCLFKKSEKKKEGEKGTKEGWCWGQQGADFREGKIEVVVMMAMRLAWKRKGKRRRCGVGIFL